MKSKVIDLIFGDSLPYKSGLGFFVPALEVPFFESPTWALLAKVVILGCKKEALPVPVRNFFLHFWVQF